MTMETRSRRRERISTRGILHELTPSSSRDDDLLNSDFTIVQDSQSNTSNNVLNILNKGRSRSSIAEEEVIKIRGRKKVKCIPFLRDLSPKTLVSLKSPMKRSNNEDVLKFLRSPTPKKVTKLIEDRNKSAKKKIKNNLDNFEDKIKKTKKCLSVELDCSNNLSNQIKKNLNRAQYKNSPRKSLRRSTNIST